MSLLSTSRQQSLLSDEQAKEVEQILSAAPTVGVAVAAVVATATSSSNIKNLIEDITPQTASPPTAEKQHKQRETVQRVVTEEEEEVDEYELEAVEEEEEVEEEDNSDNRRTVERYLEEDINNLENVTTTNQQHHQLQQQKHHGAINIIRNDVEVQSCISHVGIDKYEEDDDDIEDVDIVGIGATSMCINSTFTSATTSTAVDNKQETATAATPQITRTNDDDEPEWLRDVLEAPKRSLENLLIASTHNSGSSGGYDNQLEKNSIELHQSSASSPPAAAPSATSPFTTSDVVLVTTASKVETTYDEANDSTTIYIAANQWEHHQQQQQYHHHQSFESNDQESLLNRSFIQDSTVNSSTVSLQQSTGESLHESIVSVESTQSDATFNQTTTVDDSIISSKHNSTYSLNEPISLNTTTTSAALTELDDSQFYIPEYPPVRSKEVYVESGVHYFEDGNFWMEVPGE